MTDAFCAVTHYFGFHRAFIFLTPICNALSQHVVVVLHSYPIPAVWHDLDC